jgi:hypothetical protein
MNQGMMTVEVDLYSGRENPRYTLGPRTVQELARRLEVLPAVSGAVSAREGLGYRGLHLIAVASETPAADIRVSNGVVILRDERSGAERRLGDPRRELERWLIDVGADELGPDLMAVLTADLASPP